MPRRASSAPSRFAVVSTENEDYHARMGADWWWWLLAVAAIGLLARQWINSAKPPPTSLRCNHCPRLARRARALTLGIVAAGFTALAMGIMIGRATAPESAPLQRTVVTPVPAAPNLPSTSPARQRPAATGRGR